MSVDHTAKLIYGYSMNHKEFEEIWTPYWKFHTQCEDLDNYYCLVDAYDNQSDIVFGVELDSTSYYHQVKLIAMRQTINEYKQKLINMWTQAMPHREEKLPGLILVQHQW